MGHPTRLRISLADRAGALAQAATVIGLHGGNIASIDVLSASGDSAVDDLVVDFHSEPDLTELAEDLASNAGATLLSHQPAEMGDLIEGALCLAASLVPDGRSGPGSQGGSLQALSEALRVLTNSVTAWISTADDAVSYPSAQRAVATGQPESFRSSSVPPALVGILPGEVSLLAVPVADQGSVIFLARAAPNDFTATEAARVVALTSLFVKLAN